MLRTILFGLIIFKMSMQQQITDYEYTINQWHQKRITNLKSENGWLNLYGFYWLDNDKILIGNEKECKIKLEKIVGIAGELILKNNEVWFNNFKDNSKCIYSEKDKIFEIVKLNSYRFFVIKRNNQLALRVRDLDSEVLKNFKGIERFPVNIRWKIEADYQKFDKDSFAMIINRMGFPEETKLSGIVKFKIDSNNFSLLVFDEEGKHFIVFSDLTSGNETYGGGRFLYADNTEEKSKLILDFNKSYNPPCSFTPYATCPLPPEGNKLNIRIEAGEKVYQP